MDNTNRKKNDKSKKIINSGNKMNNNFIISEINIEKKRHK